MNDENELTTYQKLLMTVDVNQGGVHSAMVDAKILAECIDENKTMSFDEYIAKRKEITDRTVVPSV